MGLGAAIAFAGAFLLADVLAPLAASRPRGLPDGASLTAAGAAGAPGAAGALPLAARFLGAAVAVDAAAPAVPDARVAVRVAASGNRAPGRLAAKGAKTSANKKAPAIAGAKKISAKKKS